MEQVTWQADNGAIRAQCLMNKSAFPSRLVLQEKAYLMVGVPAGVFNPSTQIESLPRKLEGDGLCRVLLGLQDGLTE
jgi:hypothetical protein